MPLPFRPLCQPTSLGPLPHTEAAAAWDIVMRHTTGLPALPLLPNAGETLAVIGAEGFQGVTVSNVDVALDRDMARNGLSALYAAYLRGTSPAQSVELAAMPRLLPSEQTGFRRTKMLCGLLIGPVSLTMTVVDEQTEPVINDAELVDALAKHLFLRRIWLQKMLERMGKPALVWLYEPYLSVVRSPFAPLALDDLAGAVDQALGRGLLRALWLPDAATAAALSEALAVDVIGLPLPEPEQAGQLKAWLEQRLATKTALGWGIVPVTSEGLRSATAGRLAARFEAWLQALQALGLPVKDVLATSLIMPEDTLAYLDIAEAERALALTTELSSLIRQSYGVD
jgi:hypothetical protein